jgi:hypothetical protein
VPEVGEPWQLHVTFRCRVIREVSLLAGNTATPHRAMTKGTVGPAGLRTKFLPRKGSTHKTSRK